MITHLIRFDALSHDQSQLLNAHLEERLDLEQATITSHEIAEDSWVVEVYGVDSTTPEALSALVRDALGDYPAPPFHTDSLSDTDWVQKSLAGLPPVHAGRIFVHGSHDRHRIPPNCLSIEIEAALAFGTGHHGTTLGCLLEFNELIKLYRPGRILDVGTGTGVLAIAAALTLKTPVMASDIDPVSVTTALANARLNKAAPWLHVVEATGMQHRDIQMNAPYDLIFANILAAPLIELAPDIVRATMPDGFIILSGLLEKQIQAVSAAYRNRGCTVLHTRVIEGWAALTLQKHA